MKREFCVFNNKKSCTDCGECERCDLNSNKQCDNCGKCLEMQGFDMKGIKIDDIIEDNKEVKEYQVGLENNSELKDSSKKNDNNLDEGEEIYDNYIDGYESHNAEDVDAWNDNIEYIDDIDGLSELMEDEDKLKKYAHEEFPGLIRFEERKGHN